MILAVLTGSIGMGKSETLKMFKKRGVPVFDSDKAVHELYSQGALGTKFIEKHFPEAVKNNAVDRKILSKIVMSDAEAIERIEEGIHPLVHQMQEDFINANQNAKLLIFDIPLYFEQDRTLQFDKVIVVSAPYEVQRDRVLVRPGMTIDKFEKITSLQTPDAEKRAKADFIIETDKGFAHAQSRVDDILSELQK